MKPADFLKNIQAKYPSSKINPNTLPDFLKQYVKKNGLNPNEICESLNNRDFAQDLLNTIFPHLPKELRELIDSGKIVSGMINCKEPNIEISPLGNEGWVICFNSGLKDLIYRVSRAVSLMLVVGEIPEKPESDSLRDTARIIAEVLWWCSETGLSSGPQFSINESQLEFASKLATASETFLIAHELGHILTDIYDKDKITKIVPNLPKSLLNHQEEFTADAFGFGIVMNTFHILIPSNINSLVSYAGIEFTLQIYQCMEKLGFYFEDTHPSASKRIKFIRENLQKMPGSLVRKPGLPELYSPKKIEKISTTIDRIFTATIEIIINPGEHEKFYEREAQSLCDELDSLLNICVQGCNHLVNPTEGEQITFNELAYKIFSRGYSNELLSKVAKLVTSVMFILDDQEHAKDDYTDDDMAKEIHKYQLLLHFIQSNLSEPMRSVFLNEMKNQVKSS